MRRLLVSLFIALSCSVCFAQEHLQIMGIPIDGNLETFKENLIRKGLKLEPLEEFSCGCDIYTTPYYIDGFLVKDGVFVGEKIGIIQIGASPLSKTVYKVTLYLIFDTEYHAKRFVNRIVKVAENKYNTISSRAGNYTNLNLDNGTINVEDADNTVSRLSKYFPDKWKVRVTYWDEENYSYKQDPENRDIITQENSDI